MRRKVTMLLSGIVAATILTTVAAFPVNAYGATATATQAKASNRFSSATSYTKAPFTNLKKGSSGESVLLLQEKLALIGMFDKSKYYPKLGDYTVTTISDFQKTSKISTTGVYDQSTAAKLDAKVYTFSKIVKPGEKNVIVSIVKRNLSTLGFFKGKIDETLDKDLEAALKKYQIAKKLPTTGNIGPMTLKNISLDLAKKTSDVKIAKGTPAKPKAIASNTTKKTNTKVASVVKNKKKTPVVAANSTNAKVAIVSYAKSFLKYRYVYGGASSRGYDCSGLMMTIMRKYGVNLPHSSAAQSKGGKKVSLSQLQPGDLLFFGRGAAKIGHVGMYIGNDKFIHASSPTAGIKIDTVSTYSRKVVVARRYPIHIVK